MECDLIFEKRYHNALERICDAQKESDYEKVIAAGFDSPEIWDLWYDSEDDVGSFIEYLNELEVNALCRMNEMEDET
jgi:hypothetical protein